MGFIDDVRLARKEYGKPENLPDAIPGTVYIVSSQLCDALRDIRSDLIAPDDLVRNEKGEVIGCRSFWCC